jgi:hypothetical protein
MTRFRSIAIFKLGVLAGMATAAAFARGAMPSRGDEESDEVSLVAVFDGIDLKSRARAFRGGSMLAWFGGIAVDLRDAELAPDARLSLRTLFGGIAVKTQPNWRVESRLKAVAGGVDVPRVTDVDADAPVLALDGLALFGGIAVGAKAGPATRGTPDD